ncbi:MAG: DNA polymerase III subunit delta [Bacteroidales bacterium]|nr:DNA polymerase III subunit delta [Bacteroidales bacterium]
MAEKLWTFEDIMRDIRAKHFYPVYLLMGDEPYYPELITQTVTDSLLTEEERDFNQTIFYGPDCDVTDVINTAKRYPMMSDYQLVIVREAQMLKRIEDLSHYLQKPLRSTVLVIEYKNASADKRKSFVALAAKEGVVFESKKLYDNKLPAFIASYLKVKGCHIEPKAAQMLVDFLGNDLGKLTGEIDKLMISMGGGNKVVTPELVESNIGISKDYNNFEFLDALLSGDVLKANRIVLHFGANPKSYPLVVTLSVLFNFFSNLMIAHYLPNKTEEGLMSGLSLKRSFLVKPYLQGLRRFSAGKTMQIISYIRTCDAQAKGVGVVSADDRDLLRELVFKILH